MSFTVGNYTFDNPAILSPMDGYSDMPFRSVCRDLGSAMSYTEFVNALDVLNRPRHVAYRLAYRTDERPVVFQLYDSEPARLLEAALRLQERQPDIIDINMGCSDPSVSGRGAGAGLLRTPLKVARIFRMLSRALEIPVTGKIRLGWDDDCRNHVLIARIIEDNGGQLVAVHGRTKVQAYGGSADWDAIAEVRQAVSIPVLGNGDIRTPQDMQRMFDHTGVDGVLIGRGAIGNPWIFGGRRREDVPVADVRALMHIHLERSIELYGLPRGLVLFRKHAQRYLAPWGMPVPTRKALLTCEDPLRFRDLLEEFLQGVGDGQIIPLLKFSSP